ncbi:hypothetical protein [Cellulosilyticum sp. I15G10I2]|uniref:hypothetical protein n=1 Tax=Cellulosilyticum sp. I15G10I2 TaxID=1892843 RepID=UPI00085BE3C2|nr:hypothetical protein [Cellulosilyticum sp. I15G10I2]
MKQLIKVMIFFLVLSLNILCYAGQDVKPEGWGTLSTRTNESIATIWCDGEYNLGLSDSYNLYEWGHVGGENISTPRLILKNAREILDSAGAGYGAITHNNELYLWGLNYNNIVPSNNVTIPTKVRKGVKNAFWGGFLVNNGHSMSSDSNLYTVNLNNELFVQKYTAEAGWKDIKVMDNVEKVYYGGYARTIAITTDHELYIWSPLVYLKSIDSTLYDKSALNVLSGQEDFVANGLCDSKVGPIKLLDNVKEVSSSVSGFMALTYDADIYVWGDCAGLLGKKNITSTPEKYISNVKSIWAGRNRARFYYIDNNSYLWTTELLRWKNEKPILSKVKNVYSGVKQVVHAGIDGERFLLENGKVLSKGTNNYGELGIGVVSAGVWDKYSTVLGFKTRSYPTQSYISNNSNVDLSIERNKVESVKLFSHNNKTYVPIRALIDSKVISIKIAKTGDYEITDLKKNKKYIFNQPQILKIDGKSYLVIREFANQFGYKVSMQGKVLDLS